MRHIGFSTGAVAAGDFSRALTLLQRQPDLDSVELSALRLEEVGPMLQAIPLLDLRSYRYVSFHAPSSFTAQDEADLVEVIERCVPAEWPIVLHPDTIHNFSLWRKLGRRVAIENMDRRKSIGRNARELGSIFEQLPEAAFCFDVGHARQCDTSMSEAYRILEAHWSRLVQLHVSEVNSASHHEPISYATKLGFQSIAHLIPPHIPLIIESKVSPEAIGREVQAVLASLPMLPETAALRA